MNNSSVSYLRKPLALLGVGLSFIAVNAAFGQAASSAAAPAADDTMKLDKFVVTGSSIPAAADEAKALPVQVFDTQAIQITGVNTNVLDLLRKMVPQIQGGNNIGVENANIAGGTTNGGSQVSLRNTDTLVLVNGKRVAASAVAAGGESGTGGQFVDLNIVPISAVDRIEVLTDGASAIYGTDAVSGVINVILRKDYQGAEVGFHYTAAPQSAGGGYWNSRSFSIIGGATDGKTHVMFSAEWTKSDPLWQRETSYDNPYYGTASYPGVINDSGGNFYSLKSGLNSPTGMTPTSLANLVANGTYVPNDDVTSGFNLSEKPTVMNSVDKRIATLAASHSITDQITAKGDFLYAYTHTYYELNPQPVSASNTSLISYGVSPITDTNVTVRNRFIYGPNRIYDNTTHFYRVTAELEGKVNDYFNWDAYANYNVSYQLALGKNQILNSALLAGIKGGLIDLFAIQQDPAKLAQANIFGISTADYTSQLITYNANAYGKIWELPAGDMAYAAGVEYRKETLHSIADYNSVIPPGATTSLWNNGTSLAPFDGQRHVNSEFGELKIPVTSPKQAIPGLYTLTLDGAVRHEAYSDGNKTTVPKYSLRYLPFNTDFAFRATYAKSFTAPTLYDLYGPSSSGFTTSLGGVNAYNTDGTAKGTKFANLQGLQLNGFNPYLTPATAKSTTIGGIYSPKYIKGLEITLDYYKIQQDNLIGSPGGTITMVQSVEELGAASPFSNYVTLNNFAGQGGTHVTTPGQLSANPQNIYVLQNLVNIASQSQHGWDLNVKYTLPEQEYGRFVISSEWAFLQSFNLKSDPTDTVGTEYAGQDDYGTLAKARAYSTVDWEYKGYGATLGWTYVKSVKNFNDDTIPAYNTFDVQMRFNLEKMDSHLRGMSVNLGINNFTNRMPPLDRYNYSSPPFDGSSYSFFGRMYYMDVRVKF